MVGFSKYYLARYFGWKILFAIVFAAIVDLCGINKGVNILQILFEFGAFWFCLNKVFFKPYKRIKITPKFQKLDFVFVLKQYILVTVFVYVAMLLLSLIFAFVLKIFLIPALLFVQLCIVSKIIEKHAIIEWKDSSPENISKIEE